MKKTLAIFFAIAMLFTVASFSVSAADGDVAAIGEATFGTLQAAIDAAAAGDTIELIDDVAENATINKSITLDGANHKYTGQITLNKVKATIQNINFVDSYIYKNKKTGASGLDITIKNCTFEGSLNDGYAVRIDGSSNIVIENCDAKNVDFGFLYIASSSDKISLKNVNIDGATYGIHIAYNNSTVLENVNIKNAAYGILNQTYGAKTITFKNCTVDAENPVYIWERNAKTQNFVFKGENDFGTDDLTFGSSLVNALVDVAKIGDETYASIKEAVAKAADGDVITVVRDHEIASSEAFLSSVYTDYYVFAEATDKKVTIDLNGKVVTINPDLDKMMLAVFFAVDKGAITLKDSSEAQTGAINVTATEATKVYSIFTADEGGNFLIEGGNYYLNRADSWSMLYAGHHKEFTVTGGNFVLGNGDTKAADNGELFPWITNVGGDGIGSIEISGGTYNIDPTHYHGETYYPDCYTPVEEGEVWTVKIVHTPGDAATCMAAQICTVCKEELDAVKACAFEAYVSNGDATCTEDGTKTAACIYGCGNTDTVVDEGTSKGHTPGAAATCQVAQTCTVCGTELDGIKEHVLGEYVSNNDATCTADGTKTAECIYGCGLTDTVVDEGSMGEHNDFDGSGNCDGCAKKCCEICGGFHKDMISDIICLIGELIRFLIAIAGTIF
ncbi:MAG: right-handed parallel beta-helix repeat-containing protein [Clostridia bacterium]|nr:right-handed parallel beta-helix repeat-containing protein [Clostridia bacterium]